MGLTEIIVGLMMATRKSNPEEHSYLCFQELFLVL